MGRLVESNEFQFEDSEVNGTVETWEPLAPPRHKRLKYSNRQEPKNPPDVESAEKPDGVIEIWK